MKRLWLLLFLVIPLMAQDVNTGVQYVQSAPVGRCGYQPPVEIVMLTGHLYTCANGNWVDSATGQVGVTTINNVNGAFTFSGNGVNCTGNQCLFSGGNPPPSGVQSINGNAGTFFFTGAGVSCTGTTCTFSGGSTPGVTSINTVPGDFTFSGSGVSCTGTNCVFSTGSGGITPANPGQMTNYAPGGTTVQGAPNLYAVNPAWTQAQINSLFSGLSGTNTVFIPAGAPEIGYTSNGQVPRSFRLGADYFQMPGVACDALYSNVVPLVQGNNQSTVGSSFSAADIGKTFFFYYRSGLGYGATQAVWTPTLTNWVYPTATWSSSAPFTVSERAYYGTDNQASTNAAMAQANILFPLTIPSGCKILNNETIPWNNSQSIVGRDLNSGGFVGPEGMDVIATTDTSGQSISSPGVTLAGFATTVGSDIDWTLGYNKYAADGTLTVVPPVYRPLYVHSPLAPDPLGPGWLTGGKNGVATIAQNSAVICTPNAETPPAVGQQIMFPYFSSIFTSTVSSTAGSCSSGFTARTMAAAFPNTSAYTSSQAEWFTGSAIQSTTTSIPASGITYPLTLSGLNLSTDPVPGWVSNFPQHGTVKVCGAEFEYMGTTTSTMVLRRGPTTSNGCTGTTPMAPINMCRAKNLLGSNADQPWPVTPTVNSGDSTPSGANWFPGECGGNAGIAFPTANGNSYVGSGLSDGFLEDLQFIPTNAQSTNNVAAIYVAGNNAPFGSTIKNLKGLGFQYGMVQGPASAGQHGVHAVGPTGFGNTISGLHFFDAFPLSFVDMEGGTLDSLNLNSTEVSPFDGSTIGSATCLHEGYTLDEQTGGLVTNVGFVGHHVYGCEPEGGSHIEVLPSATIEGTHLSFDTADFEGIPSVFGGDHLKLTNSSLALPAIDYGTDNDFGILDGSNAGYITNLWDPSHAQMVFWGKNAKCSAFAGGQGPAVACGAATVQGYEGRGIEPSVTGSKPYYLMGGMITPWMWNANASFDAVPMTTSGQPDTTAKYWGASATCNIGSGLSCQSAHFNGFNGYLYIGPFNQLYDGPYLLDASFKTLSSTSTFTLTIRAQDSGTGQCSSPATLYTGTVSTTTSFTAFNAGGSVIDMTGKAGCVLEVQFNGGSTTDTLVIDRFNFVPQQQQLNTVNATLGPVGQTAGSDSGDMRWQALYNTGSGLALDTYDAYVQIGGGVNPFSQLVFNHSSGTPGGGEIEFAIQSNFQNGVVVQGGTLQVDDLGINSSVCTDASSQLTTSGCSGGGAGGLTPKQFGGYGDGLQIPNGCTTNGTTTVVCPAAPFVSGDVGKLLCVSGAGAAGVGFCSAIATFVSNTTVTVSATPSTNVTTAYAVYGHDDVVAIQDCINASSLQGGQCFLGTATPNLFLTPAGYLVASAGLLIPTHANIAGSSMYGGSTILSEYNGDLFSLTQGTSSLYAGQPISGVTISNLGIYHDPSQPAGRGFHINSAPGIYGFGGMYYSTFTNVDDENAALECLWLDGHTNSDDNPNQYLTFNNLVCDGPNQAHPANEIKMTGIQAQILFENGAINGITQSNYPNPLIYIGEKTTGQGDSPGAVKFLGFTYEVGTQGLYVGNGAVNIHFDDGYIEQVESPLIVQDSVQGLTFRGNHIANSGNIGAIAQFSTSSLITATLQDNQAEGSSPSPAALAVCSGSTNNFAIDFLNNISPVSATANCSTNHIGTGAALFQPTGTTATVDASSVVITTIRDPNVPPGKTLTLKALSGGVGSFSLGTGGTPTGTDYPIDLGANASPLVVAAGNSVILALLDVSGAPVYTVIGGTGLPLTPGAGRKGTFTCTAGGTITITNGFELATSDVVISLNAQGGTISTVPAMKTVSAGTGFSVLCGAADTSIYNYDIVN